MANTQLQGITKGTTVSTVATVTPTDANHNALDVNIVAGGGGASTIADGADVAEGSTTDTAIVSDNNGTLSGKLRGLVKILADVWDSVNHRLKIDGSGVTQPVSNAGLSNIDAALSTRLKPADTLTGVTTVGAVTSITNPVAVTLAVAPTTAVTVADGANVVEGLTTDTAVQGDTLGTISAKLRGINIALQQLQQANTRNAQAQMALFAACQQVGPGFIVTPEVPAFLGGF